MKTKKKVPGDVELHARTSPVSDIVKSHNGEKADGVKDTSDEQGDVTVTASTVEADHSALVADFHSLLSRNYKLLSRCIDASNELLFKLKSVDYMRHKVPQIRRQPTQSSRVAELLNVLDEVPDSQQQLLYNTFVLALRDDGQEHVANIFRKESDARPMSDEHYRLMLEKPEELKQFVSPSCQLLETLVRVGVLNQNDKENISNRPNYSDKSSELISIIARKPDTAFYRFIESLSASDQQHVVYIITGEGDENVFNTTFGASARRMSNDHCQLLLDKTEELRQFINPTYALFDKLVRCGILSNSEKVNISSLPNSSEMSAELVSIILRKPDSAFYEFIEALKATDQHHVVYILTGEGRERPLSLVRRKVLIKARNNLVRKLEIKHSTLVAELISNGVLNEVDMLRIEARETSEDKTGVLLDAIARKSQSAYDKFIQALKHRDIGQLQIARALEGLELRGYLKTNFDIDAPDVDLNRNKIIQIVRDKMKALISGNERDIKELTHIMEQNGFAVSDISEGSIRITFTCFSEESLDNLKRLYDDKTLNDKFTQAFCPKFVEYGIGSMELQLADEEFRKLTDAFRQMAFDDQLDDTSVTLSDTSSTAQQQQHPSLMESGSLPMELLEMRLLRTYLALFTVYYRSHNKTHEAVRLAYSTLAAVCYNWWQTMNGWPHSPTKHWYRHKLRRVLKRVCRPYAVFPRIHLTHSISESVYGVTVNGDKMFVVCWESETILVFGSDGQPLTNLKKEELKDPTDIVSCTETQQLYVAGESRDSTRCVWRVSSDGRQIVKWLPNKSTTTTSAFKPSTLSVTSRRLLVTSQTTNELSLYGADGSELKRITFSDMTSLQHAVETSRGTFIVCHGLPQPRVCEINVDGHVTRVYSDRQQLERPAYLSLDSDGRVFVADWEKYQVLLLNSRLELERVLLDRQQHQLVRPWRMCFTEETGQLAVGGRLSHCVRMFTVR